MVPQGGGMNSQNAFPSLVSPRNQFHSTTMLGNIPNVSSLLHQSFGNGGPSSGISQRGLIDNRAGSDPLYGVENGMVYSPHSSSNLPAQVQGQQKLFNQTEQQQTQQIDPHSFQHNQQFQAMRSGLGGSEPVKLEPQVANEQAPHHPQRNLGAVKLEPQSLRSLGPVKMDPPNLDPSFFPHHHQQQLLLSRQSSQAAQILHQQKLMQIQQQQQLLKNMPQQRPQFNQPQNLSFGSSVKPVYEPGLCARRLTHYMYQQQHRPEDNNIEFWRKFVAEYFAPNAKKKWCVSMYGSGRQTTGVFPQDVWQCEICNRKPGRGFEATAEVLPRLFRIKYESGTLEELLYIDMPREYQNSSGQIVLDYAKTVQESVFEQLRVVREGQLRIVFSPDLKICSWEFCARRHEELIPRRLLIPQVSHLGAVAQKYLAATQNTSSDISVSELQNNCNMFVSSARQLVKALEVPLVNDLGYTKRYVRCLQISEVVNSMKDLIDYSRETGTGPMESLSKFPRRTNPSHVFHGQPQQPESQLQQHQTTGQNSNNDNNTMNSVPSTSSSGTIVSLLHQNSRPQNPLISSTNGPYNSVHLPSPAASSPFQSPTPSSSNNPHPTSHNTLSGPHVNSTISPHISIPRASLSGDADANDSQSSVQKIIYDMLMSSQLGGSGNMLVANGLPNGHNPRIGQQPTMVNGIRGVPGNYNSLSGNSRVGMSMNQQQQQDLSNQVLGNLGAANGFNNLQFDWKTSP